MNAGPSEALALLRTLGVPTLASELYLTLLSAGAMRVSVLAATAGLAPSAIVQAIDYLKIFRLLSQDVVDDEMVVFASNPRNAWKAHDTYFYWARSLHVGDIEDLPPLPEMVDQERRRCYARLEKICGSIYDLNARAHDPLRHRHREIHSAELFSSLLAAAISSARSEIIAVDLPPRLPDLAPIWVALTRRIRAGVKYTRIVGIDEIAEHGLDIVTRDIQQYGIRLRIAQADSIKDAYYLIDKKRLLLKNNRGLLERDEKASFGVYTSHYAIVRRYRERFSDQYMPASTDAGPVVDRLRENVERFRSQLNAESRVRESSLLYEVACFGKFAEIRDADVDVVSHLLDREMLVRNAAGHLVMTVEGS